MKPGERVRMLRRLGIFLLIATMFDMSRSASANESPRVSDEEVEAETQNQSAPSQMNCQNTFSILNGTYWCHTHCWNAQGLYAGGDLTVIQTANPHEAMMKCQEGITLESVE